MSGRTYILPVMDAASCISDAVIVPLSQQQAEDLLERFDALMQLRRTTMHYDLEELVYPVYPDDEPIFVDSQENPTVAHLLEEDAARGNEGDEVIVLPEGHKLNVEPLEAANVQVHICVDRVYWTASWDNSPDELITTFPLPVIALETQCPDIPDIAEDAVDVPPHAEAT